MMFREHRFLEIMLAVILLLLGISFFLAGLRVENIIGKLIAFVAGLIMFVTAVVFSIGELE